MVGVSDSPRGPQACYWYYDEAVLDWVAVGIGALSSSTFGALLLLMAFWFARRRLRYAEPG